MGYRLVHLAALSIAGRTHDNRSHAASEGRYRGSDLAVTAGELNAGSGVGRLGACPRTSIFLQEDTKGSSRHSITRRPPCKQGFSSVWPIRVAASDALVGPMWSQHGSVRFEVPVTFLVETLLVNCSHLVRHTHEVHFPHLAGGNVELHNRAWASANHVPIDF